MANPECNALTYIPAAGTVKAQVVLRSLPNAAGQVTNYAFPWSGPPITANVAPDGTGLPPITADKPYT